MFSLVFKTVSTINEQICCPNGGNEIIFEDFRECDPDELHDYYWGEAIDCIPPGDYAPREKYIYNDASACSNEAKCTKGSQCGSKGRL